MRRWLILTSSSRMRERALFLFPPLRLCFGFVALLAWCSPAMAVQIILNSGKPIEGDIVEETDNLIKVQLKDSQAVITLGKSRIKEIVRSEGQTQDESDGDRGMARKEYAAARDLYRGALRQAKDEGTRQRLNEKIAKCSAGIVAANKAKLEEAYRKGLEALSKNGFVDMAAGLDLIDSIHPENEPGGAEGVTARDVGFKKASLYTEKAKKERDRLQYDLAAASIEQAIKFADNVADLYLTRGDLLRRSGANQNKAIEDYVRGIELAGDQLSRGQQAQYHYDLGEMLSSKGRWEEALAHLFKAIALAPAKHKKAPSLAAEAYLAILDKQGERDLVRKADEKTSMVQRLIELGPSDALSIRLRQRLADLYTQKGDVEKAVEALKGIIAAFPYVTDIHYRISKCYMTMSQRSQTKEDRQKYLALAEQEFNNEIAMNPRNYEAFCDLAAMYYDAFRLDNASRALEEAIKLEPAKWRAYYQMMHVCMRLGDRNTEADSAKFYDLAMENAKNLIDRRGSKYPEYYDGVMVQATVLARKKQYAEAESKVESVRKALESRPLAELSELERLALSEAYNQKGGIALEDDAAINLARDDYEKAIAINDKNADAHASLAEAVKRLASRRFDSVEARNDLLGKAEAEFKRAIALEPENPDRYQALGILYYRDMKDPAKALEQFKEYQNLGGTSESVRKYIDEIERMSR